MIDQIQFSFKVSVCDPGRAFQKVKDFFESEGIAVEGFNFKGKGFEGYWSQAGADICINIRKKPLWIFNETIVRRTKEFLKDV
jgi:hypothetical protein